MPPQKCSVCADGGTVEHSAKHFCTANDASHSFNMDGMYCKQQASALHETGTRAYTVSTV